MEPSEAYESQVYCKQFDYFFLYYFLYSASSTVLQVQSLKLEGLLLSWWLSFIILQTLTLCLLPTTTSQCRVLYGQGNSHNTNSFGMLSTAPEKYVGGPRRQKEKAFPPISCQDVRLLVMHVLCLLCLPLKTHTQLPDLAVTQKEVSGCSPG